MLLIVVWARIYTFDDIEAKLSATIIRHLIRAIAIFPIGVRSREKIKATSWTRSMCRRGNFGFFPQDGAIISTTTEGHGTFNFSADFIAEIGTTEIEEKKYD